MSRYLLAVEADKIQDLLFRSSKLREVAGGSQLLTRFCEEMPKDLGVTDKEDIIVNDGGSFRILFDSEEEAKSFGERLAEAYWRVTGGTLTMAEPVPVNGNFRRAHKQAHENLRRAKRRPAVKWQGQEHQPYVAFCASCGVGLAVTHTAYYEDENKQYLCESCWNKSRVGRAQREKSTPKDRMGEFLADFYQVVAEKSGIDFADLHWPGEIKNPTLGEIDPLEDVSEYDPRRYVAYIVADGNNMGQVFGTCEKREQMQGLSKGLRETVRKALAKPTSLLMAKQEHPPKLPGAKEKKFVPVYPLILGGDDIFVLIPAPWALDFARRFAKAYEEEMKSLIDKIGLKVTPPTISVAVVICKSKHPYTQAHEAGEHRLSEAKQMSKRLQLIGKHPASTVTFEVVLGGRLVEPIEQRKVRPTLRPYWAQDGNLEPGWGLPLETLIKQRRALAEKGIPRKRLAELKNLFDAENIPQSMSSDEIKPWQKRLEQLLNRIGRTKGHREVVEGALQALGDSGMSYWREISRYGEDYWYGHGLPDLLEAWDFALDLDKCSQDYEEA